MMTQTNYLSQILRAIQKPKDNNAAKCPIPDTENIGTINWALKKAGGIVYWDNPNNPNEVKKRFHVRVKHPTSNGDYKATFTFAAQDNGNVDLSRYTGLRIAAGLLAKNVERGHAPESAYEG
jgi:hypothetical protein